MCFVTDVWFDNPYDSGWHEVYNKPHEMEDNYEPDEEEDDYECL